MTGTMSMHGHGGTLPPVPLPRLTLQAQMAARAASIASARHLDNTSSSEEEDKADLLGRNFQVPRPKSRSNASIAVSIVELEININLTKITFYYHKAI